MLRFWIVTSSLFVALCGADVNFTFGSDCFSKDGNLELTAEYTGSGTVSAVQWYYSGQVGNNLAIFASTCTIFGTVDAGYPDTSRMTFTCPTSTKFTLTLTDIQTDELDKSWGATFTLTSGPSPSVADEPIPVCTATTTSTTLKTTTSTTTIATKPTSTKTTTPMTITSTMTTTTTPTTRPTTTPIMTTTTTPTTRPTTTPVITTTTTLTMTATTTPTTTKTTTSLSDKMIIVIVVVPVGVLAVVGTVIFFCLFYRLRRGKRKPTSHERHKQRKHYKGNKRSVQQHHQQPNLLYGIRHIVEPIHKETKRSQLLHNDDRYNWYDRHHWGSQVKQNPVYKGDRNLDRLYFNESLPRYDDYRSGYTRGHVYRSHTSGYHYRPEYYGDSRGHGNHQHSSYPVYSTQQEYINPSYSYMGY